jgi:hypothetical protein
MTMHPDQLREEVAAVFGEIVAAKRLVRSGRSVELDGLDTRVGALCEAVVALSGEDGRALLPLLGDLRTSLDELAESLKAASPGDNDPAAP